MSKDASWPLQQAVYQLLTTVLAPVLVFDDVNGDQPTPYVVVGDTTVVDDSNKTGSGQEHALHLHFYSQKEGRKEAKLLMAKCYDAMHDQDIEIEGHGTVSCRFDWQSSIDLDEDGKTLHGIVRYMINTYPIT